MRKSFLSFDRPWKPASPSVEQPSTGRRARVVSSIMEIAHHLTPPSTSSSSGFASLAHHHPYSPFLLKVTRASHLLSPSSDGSKSTLRMGSTKRRARSSSNPPNTSSNSSNQPNKRLKRPSRESKHEKDDDWMNLFERMDWSTFQSSSSSSRGRGGYHLGPRGGAFVGGGGSGRPPKNVCRTYWEDGTCR